MHRECLDNNRVGVGLLEFRPGEERIGVPGEGGLVSLLQVFGVMTGSP